MRRHTEVDVEVLVFEKKAGEIYCWMYDSERTGDVLRTMGRFATDPEMSFTWYDAAILAKKVRGLR